MNCPKCPKCGQEKLTVRKCNLGILIRCEACGDCTIDPTGRPSKYRNRQVELGGFRFHSAGEARRWEELLLLLASGELTYLERQKPFSCHVNGVTIGKWVADFYYITRDGETVVEDFKGFPTSLYRWKKKHVEAEYGLTIKESRG